MQVEIGATRVDQQASGIVVDKERQVHALARDLDPGFILAVLLPLPDQRAVVVAGARRDGRDHRVGADRLAADFNHAHRGAANFRERRIENQAAALQQAESVNEEPDPSAEAEDTPEQKSAWARRTQD